MSQVQEESEIPDSSVITTDTYPVEGRVVTPVRSPWSYVVETSQLNIVPKQAD